MKFYNSFNEMFNANNNANKNLSVFNGVRFDPEMDEFVVDYDGCYVCSVQYYDDPYADDLQPGLRLAVVFYFEDNPGRKRYNKGWYDLDDYGYDLSGDLVDHLYKTLMAYDNTFTYKDGAVQRLTAFSKEEAKEVAEMLSKQTKEFMLKNGYRPSDEY